MSKIFNRAAFAVLGFAVASSAFAQTTQTNVNFNGELTANTCSIDSGSLDQTVTLPQISTTTLANAGDVAGSTPFDLVVANCSPSVNQVAAHFEMTNMDAATRTLQNLADPTTGATNVTVQLVNADGTPVQVGSTGNYFNVSGSGATRGATLTYGGEYYALGQTTAGTVQTFTSLTLAYQ